MNIATPSTATVTRRPFGGFAVGMTVLLVLGCFDAVLTVWNLNHGAAEANPLMAALLAQGTGVFFAGKLLLTFVGASLICCCLRERSARRALLGVSATYVLLLGWHVVLLAR